MDAKEYFQRDPEREAFYRTFYQICRRFNVTWSTATPEVRAFVEEATRVTYEQEKAQRSGLSPNTVKPFFRRYRLLKNRHDTRVDCIIKKPNGGTFHRSVPPFFRV